MNRRKITCLLAVLLFSLGVMSCSASNNDPDRKPTTIQKVKCASVMTEDGWVYAFAYEKNKVPVLLFQKNYFNRFYCINLRYKYDDDYCFTEYRQTKTKAFIERYHSGLLRWENKSDARKRDWELVYQLIDDKGTPEKLLAIKKDEVNFEELDKELFFSLIHQALEGDWQPDPDTQRYYDKPMYALFVEPQFWDGYKFQVGYTTELGLIEHVFIDVLYRTGDGIFDYVQLSDMIDDQRATPEQAELYSFLKELEDRIEQDEHFIAGSEEYCDKVIAGADLGRLADFLFNIHDNRIEEYVESPFIVETIPVEMSE